MVERSIDGFSATGSRSADLISKDSTCAQHKKIAFLENEKKEEEWNLLKSCALTRWPRPKEAGRSNPAYGARPSADASHSPRRGPGGRPQRPGVKVKGACGINHIKLWLFQRSEFVWPSMCQMGGALRAEALSQLTDLDKASDWCILLEHTTAYLLSGLVTKHADRNYAECSKHWTCCQSTLCLVL